MTEQDMNFTPGCMNGLMPLRLILTCITRARSFGEEGKKKKKNHETNHVS